MREPKHTAAMRWLIQAEDELEDAIRLKEMERYYLVLYLCQQCAEKAMKAFLYYNEIRPLLTHSVNDLISLAIEIDSEFDQVRAAGRLDDYYIPTRYPNGLPGGIPSRYYQDDAEAERAIILSKKVVDLVRRKIGGQES